MKKLMLMVIATAISVSTFAQTTWKADPMHSFVAFSIKHMGISFVNGNFTAFSGTLAAAKEDLSDAKINFTADVNSVNTTVAMRDKHLKSGDFFDAEKYPTMKFESTNFKKLAGDNYELSGKLTIKDVTKDVVFKVVNGGTAKDNKGTVKAGFSATTNINRLDYNIDYDPAGAALAKNVEIKLNLEFIKTP